MTLVSPAVGICHDPFPLPLIGTPCYGGLVTHSYMQSILDLLPVFNARGVNCDILLLANDSLVTRSRNTITAQLLDRADFTHLLFVDADISFTPDAVLRLLNLDQDVAAGMYPVKNIDWHQMYARRATAGTPDELRPSGMRYVGKILPLTNKECEERDGFVTGLYAGTGFMLVKRDVFDRLAAAYPELHYKSQHQFPVPAVPSKNLYNFYDCIIEPETGEYLSEDFTFCYRWRKIGGRIWLDTLTSCRTPVRCAFRARWGTELFCLTRKGWIADFTPPTDGRRYVA